MLGGSAGALVRKGVEEMATLEISDSWLGRIKAGRISVVVISWGGGGTTLTFGKSCGDHKSTAGMGV